MSLNCIKLTQSTLQSGILVGDKAYFRETIYHFTSKFISFHLPKFNIAFSYSYIFYNAVKDTEAQIQLVLSVHY